jgi:hypothetical protein
MAGIEALAYWLCHKIEMNLNRFLAGCDKNGFISMHTLPGTIA